MSLALAIEQIKPVWKLSDEDINYRLAEITGMRVIDIPFAPNLVRNDDRTVFTSRAADQWRLTYPNGKAAQRLPDYVNSLDLVAGLEDTSRFNPRRWACVLRRVVKWQAASASLERMESWRPLRASAKCRAVALLVILEELKRTTLEGL